MPAAYQLAPPRLPEHVDRREEARHPFGQRHPKCLELFGPPAQAHAQHKPAAGDQVDHRGVLRQADRLVQRGKQQRRADQDPPGARGDRGAHRQQRGQVCVVHEVVLGHPH